MTDKLMPPDHDQSGLPAGFGGESDGLGMPGASGFGTPGPGSASTGSKFSGQVILAAAVLALAGGAIYGMRFYGLNAAFGGEDIKIDYTAEAGLEATKRFDKVMTELDASMTAVQVVDNSTIASDPFTRPKAEEPSAMVYEEPDSMDDLDRLARLAAERRAQEMAERNAMIQSELARLHVQSIVGGRVPAARISGQPVRVGQSIGVFTIVDIAGQTVTVEADGMRFELGIGVEPKQID